MDVAPRMCACSVTQFCPTLRPPWTAACQAPPSMEFSRQKSWSRNHFLLQRIFLTEGLSLHLLPHLHWQADSSQLRHLGSPGIAGSSYISSCGHHDLSCIFCFPMGYSQCFVRKPFATLFHHLIAPGSVGVFICGPPGSQTSRHRALFRLWLRSPAHLTSHPYPPALDLFLSECTHSCLRPLLRESPQVPALKVAKTPQAPAAYHAITHLLLSGVNSPNDSVTQC